MRPYWLAAFACSLLTVCQVQAQDERSAYLIANSNRAGNPCGIAVLPEGGALAPALAKAGRFIVVSQEADDGAVRATCAATEKTGLLGRRLYICESPSNRIIVADKCANLIAYTRVTDATLGSFDPKYLLSKLSPYDGRAVVGLAKGAEGALTKAKLQAWAKGFGVPDVQIVEDEQGLWALVTRPALPNADEWTHTYHAEDNNPYSRDTALTWPFMTQWLGKPYRDGGAVHLVAGGRSFFVTEGDFSFGDRFTKLRDSNQIQARDLYNGELLWTYDIPRKYSADSRTSAYVATDKEFYLIDPTEDKAGVVVLDAQSGKQLRRLDCSTLGEQLKYLSMHRGKLYVMAGDKDVVAPAGSMWKFMNPFSVLNNRYKHDYGKYATTKISHLSLGDGRTIACLEPASGKVVWQHSEADNTIPEYQIGLTEGRLYYLAKGHAAVCLDAVTGRVIWANEAAPRRFGEYLQKDPQTWMMYHLGFCLAQSQAVLFLEPALGIIAVSPQDGRILWEIDVKRRFPVVRDGRVYVSGEQWSGRQNKDTHQVYDLLTGKGCDPDWSGDDRTPGSGCGGYNMSTNFLCSQMGVGYIFDARQRVGDYLGKKTNCVGATFVAGGLFLRPGHVCACDYTTHGYIAETSAADFDFNWKAGGKTQLRRAADYENVVPLSGDGWTCFRGSVAGANAVAVSVAPNAKVLWTAPPHTANPTPIPMTSRVATDFEPVQPVAAGDCVFTAGADGLIRCLDARDGAERWRFWTGGRIYASPAIWEGRLYTGSGDGYVYALEAATGRELWRFCAAPEERRLMAYGHLVSAWPVTTNILIHDGAAYLAACLLNSNGSHVYSLDAKTGDMRWHNGRSGLDDPENRIGVNTAGTLTVAQGKLWLRTNGYDLATGAFAKTLNDYKTRYKDPYNGMLGRYTGVMDGKWLVWGGRRFYSAQSEIYIQSDGVTWQIADLTSEKLDKVKPALWMGQSQQFPAWDDELLVGVPAMQNKERGLRYGSQHKLYAWDKTLLLPAILKSADMKTKKPKTDTAPPAEPAPRWTRETGTWLAIALAKNAVIAAYAERPPNAPDDKGDFHYQLAALDRKTGEPLWQIPLPGEPLFDGLAIASDGNVYVQLLDGVTIGAGAGARQTARN